MSIGENIKKFREKKGWTQQQLAEAVNVSRPWIAQIERDTKCPAMSLGKDIAKALGCDVNDLYQ